MKKRGNEQGREGSQRGRERASERTSEGRDVTTILPRKQFGRPSLQDRPIVLSPLCFLTNFDGAQT
eukprot:2098678-Pleurochrysis_carterae.AAC.1